MGCTQSKIENEEAVARCKERKHLMKEAVSSRNAFAAAHSSYATYLKNTGAALSDFSQGEAVLQNPQFSSPSTSTNPNPSIQPPPPFEIIPPPPPPPANIPPAPLYRAATMPEMLSKPQSDHVETIIEEEEGGDDEVENDGGSNSRFRRRRSGRSSRGVIEEEEGGDDEELENEGGLNSRLRTRRSHRSSRGGNREILGEEEDEEGEIRPPAPPPPSKSKPAATRFEANHTIPPQQHPAFDYFFPQVENTPGTSLGDVDEVSVSKEEIERKEFNERKEVNEKKKKNVVRGGDDDEVAVEPVMVAQNGKGSKKGKQAQVSVVEGKIVKQKVNLIQIFNELDDHFLRASESAHEVSKMLEATRMHYHSNFADNRGDILNGKKPFSSAFRF